MIVLTANFVRQDVSGKSQGVWYQDFPLRASGTCDFEVQHSGRMGNFERNVYLVAVERDVYFIFSVQGKYTREYLIFVAVESGRTEGFLCRAVI